MIVVSILFPGKERVFCLGMFIRRDLKIDFWRFEPVQKSILEALYMNKRLKRFYMANACNSRFEDPFIQYITSNVYHITALKNYWLNRTKLSSVGTSKVHHKFSDNDYKELFEHCLEIVRRCDLTQEEYVNAQKNARTLYNRVLLTTIPPNVRARLKASAEANEVIPSMEGWCLLLQEAEWLSEKYRSELTAAGFLEYVKTPKKISTGYFENCAADWNPISQIELDPDQVEGDLLT